MAFWANPYSKERPRHRWKRGDLAGAVGPTTILPNPEDLLGWVTHRLDPTQRKSQRNLTLDGRARFQMAEIGI